MPGAGAVVDDGLGALQPQQVDDRRLRQRLEPRRVLESLPVLRVECVGHQASRGDDVELRRLVQVLLDRAEVHRVDDRGLVLLGKAGRQLQLEVDLGDQADVGVELRRHRDARAFRVDPALLHEAEGEDARAGADRGEEQVEGRRRGVVTAAARRLVGLDGEAAVVRVHPLAAGEVDLHLHARILSRCPGPSGRRFSVRTVAMLRNFETWQ